MVNQVLYNPRAGRGLKGAQQLREFLPEDSLRFRDVTQVRDYAAFFAGIAPEDRVILAGGDGTLNRWINDTAGFEIPNEIWYYATGSGNDFLADTGRSCGGGPLCIDRYLLDLPVVQVKGRTYRFLNGIGYGIDGYCCAQGDVQRAKGAGPVNYTAIAIKGLLFHYRPTDAVVTVDGVRHTYKKVWLAPTMNGRYYGGGMIPTPRQDRCAAEKTLSVMIYHGCGKLKALAAFPSIFKGEHVRRREMVEVLVGHDITVEFDRPAPLQIDGETILDVTAYRAVSAAGQRTGGERAAGACAVSI